MTCHYCGKPTPTLMPVSLRVGYLQELTFCDLKCLGLHLWKWGGLGPLECSPEYILCDRCRDRYVIANPGEHAPPVWKERQT